MRKEFGAYQSAFTLMELLVTLSLFSAIMGFLMSIFFQFHNQADRMESRLRLRQEIRILERIMRNDFQKIIYLTEFMKDPLQEVDDRKSGIVCENVDLGDRHEDKVHMHVNNTSKFQRGLPFDADPEIHEVSYFLEESEEEERYLFKRREEFYVDPDITEGDRSITHTLSNNVTSFNVKFFKSGEEEALEEWDSSEFKNTKKTEDKLPSGMTISIKLKNTKGEELASDFQVNIRPNMGNGVTWQ